MARSSRSIVVAGIALIAVGAGAVVASRASKHARALDAVEAARTSRTPVVDQLKAADAALALEPKLEEGHALKALALVRWGEMAKANEELNGAGTNPVATRARAWFLFRNGDVDKALEMLAKDRAAFGDDIDALECAADRASASSAKVTEWQARLGADLNKAQTDIDALIVNEAHSVDGLTALRARARLLLMVFDDVSLERDLRRAASEAPPHERTLAERDLPAFQKITGGKGELEPLPPLAGAGDVTKQAIWNTIAIAALTETGQELDRDRLLDSNADLDRAERRLTRLCALVPWEERAWVLLARTIERRPQSNRAQMLLEKLESHFASAWTGSDEAIARARRLELVRVRLARGGGGLAKEALEALPAKEKDTLEARRIKAVLTHDQQLAADTFDLPILSENSELEGAERCAIAFVCERPFDVSRELDAFEQLHPGVRPIDLAASKAKEDPAGAIAVLLRKRAKMDPVELARTVAVARIPLLMQKGREVPLEEILKKAGLSADEMKQALELIGIKAP